MKLRRLHRAGASVLSAVALIVIVGHVCAFPPHSHAEAGAVPAHEPHHDDSSGEAVHAASCYGTTSRTPALAAPMLVAGLWGLDASERPALDGGGDLAAPTTPQRRRPLFLLHATLLI